MISTLTSAHITRGSLPVLLALAGSPGGMVGELELKGLIKNTELEVETKVDQGLEGHLELFVEKNGKKKLESPNSTQIT